MRNELNKRQNCANMVKECKKNCAQHMANSAPNAANPITFLQFVCHERNTKETPREQQRSQRQKAQRVAETKTENL